MSYYYIDYISNISISDSLHFEVKCSTYENLQQFKIDIFNPFLQESDANEMPIIVTLQRNTLELRLKLKTAFAKYNKMTPQLNGIISFLNKLEENDPFYFLPMIKLNQEAKIDLQIHLISIKNNKDFIGLKTEVKLLIGKLINNYNIYSYGGHRMSIGQPIKEKRKCRFCRLSIPKVSFNDKAHAISEGLGNKKLILFDECDLCNDKFGKTIEIDIIEYFNLFRSFFGVKAKGGKKEIRGKNYHLVENQTIKIFDEQIGSRDEFKLPFTLTLEDNNKISLQNIYKSLCKFSISLVEDDFLPSFARTIDWINGEIEITHLPVIAESISYSNFTLEPQMTIYLRKSDDFKLPYAVSEFRLTCQIFVFIIPLSLNDSIDFTQKAEYNYFWDQFRHDNNALNWNFMDYSSNIKRGVTKKLNITLEK